MSSPSTLIAVVEPDRMVKAPPGLEIGEKVLVVPMPSIKELFRDAARRARFAATRRAIGEALHIGAEMRTLSDETIVELVHRARQTSFADQ